METKDKLLYYEEISSKWTQALFLALTMIFCLLFAWRVRSARLDILAILLLGLCALFLFYSVNYRKLIIRLTTDSVELIFGIFTWRIPLENIEEIQLDDGLPALIKYGGAGIHFMMYRNRYRASFNFLEHARVVIGFKKKAGLVHDVSFSTCQPNIVLRFIREAAATNQAG